MPPSWLLQTKAQFGRSDALIPKESANPGSWSLLSPNKLAIAVLSILSVVEPYDFLRSLQVMRRFDSEGEPSDALVLGARIGERPVRLELRAIRNRHPMVAVHATGTRATRSTTAIARWVVCGDLDLKPFYRIALRHRVLARIVRDLHGVKPMRPASVFEMMIMAITEQQISLDAARKIRRRVALKYADFAFGVPVFPTPERLAAANIAGLRACGLSRYKADYVRRLASRVANGAFRPEELTAMTDERARQVLMGEKGLGVWSANYVLVRGLARSDCVPIDDLGVRDAVGRILGDGNRASPATVEHLLAPFAPHRGLAAFYLLAHYRQLPAESRRPA